MKTKAEEPPAGDSGPIRSRAQKQWAKNLAAARAKQRKSLDTVASELGVTKTHLHLIENEKRLPSAGLCALIAAHFGLRDNLTNEVIAETVKRPIDLSGYDKWQRVVVATLAELGLETRPGNRGGQRRPFDFTLTVPGGDRVEITCRTIGKGGPA